MLDNFFAKLSGQPSLNPLSHDAIMQQLLTLGSTTAPTDIPAQGQQAPGPTPAMQAPPQLQNPQVPAPQPAPTDPNAQAPAPTTDPNANIMQSLGGGNSIAQDTPHMSDQLNSLGTTAAPASPPPTKQRHSLVDIIGHVADALATVGGSTPMYQATLDGNLARQNAAEDRVRSIDMDKLKSQLTQAEITNKTADTGKINADVAETQGKANDAQVKLLGAAAKGMRSVFASSGADGANKAWPVIAQQLGLDPQRTAAIGQWIQQDPNGAITALETATAAAAKGGKDGNKFGLNPIYTTDAQGHLHIHQLSDGGELGSPELPDGETPAPGIKDVNTGDGTTVINNRTGAPIHRYIKAGGPGKDESPIVDKNGNVIGYQPTPGGNLDYTRTNGTPQQQDKRTAAAAKNYSAYKAGDDALASLDKSLLALRNDPNLAGSTGLIGGNVTLTPGQRAFAGRVKAVTGQAIPAAIAAIKSAGGAAPRAVSEITGEANGLIGPISNRNQDAGDYTRQIDEARQRLQQRRLQMAQEYKQGAAMTQPAPAPSARPQVITPPGGLRRTPQTTVRSPTISNW